MEDPSRTNRRRFRPAETPLLQGCASSDSVEYEQLKDTLDSALTSLASSTSSSSLRNGRRKRDASLYGTQSPKQQQHHRGRSPVRPLFSPNVWVDNKNTELERQQQRQHGMRKARSLERQHWKLLDNNRASPLSKNKGYNYNNKFDDQRIDKNPIPSEYINYIVTAFGENVDLYKDVLGIVVDSKNGTRATTTTHITPAKLRVAYFRKGRMVLQKNNVSTDVKSPVSVATSTDPQLFAHQQATPKQRFQAVTKAYEILTNPKWKAYYDAYGLRGNADTDATPAAALHSATAPPIPQEKSQNKPVFHITQRDTSVELQQEELDRETGDDASSMFSGSNFSILRRSNSWGPTRSRSTSRTRVCWSEQVEELVYQPDPHHSSTESLADSGATFEESIQSMDEIVVGETSVVITSAVQQEVPRLSNKKKSRIVIDSPGLTEDLEKLDKNFKRDFLDDLEMSLDGLEARIGEYVKYALSDKDDDKPSAPDQYSSEEKKDDADNDPQTPIVMPCAPTNYDSEGEESFIVKQLFSDMTKPPQLDVSAYSKRRTLAAQGRSAPMKGGNINQPRVKPKKLPRHGKRVDRVPSETDSDRFHAGHSSSVFHDAREEQPSPSPVNDSASNGWSFQNAINSFFSLWGTVNDLPPVTNVIVANQREASSSRISNPKSLANAVSRSEELLDYFELQSNSSILASIGDISIEPKTAPQPSLPFGIREKIIPFDDAVNVSTQATTKGFVRFDRHSDQLFVPSQSQLDTSDVSFLSKTTAELMSINMPDCLSNLTNQAKETLREVASVDESDAVPRYYATDKRAVETNTDATSFISSINGYMQTLADDINSFGSAVGSNLGDANRAIVETMSFPQEEVGGMLWVLQSELESTDGESKDSMLNKSLTF